MSKVLLIVGLLVFGALLGIGIAFFTSDHNPITKIFSDSQELPSGIYRQLEWNNITLHDRTVYNPNDNTCTGSNLGMQVKIDNCKAQDVDGKNIEQYVNFTWTGASSKNISWIFAYEGNLQKGQMELLRHNQPYHYDVYEAVNTWVNNYLVNNVINYTNLGSPDSRCQIGNQNNTQMYSVWRQLGGTQNLTYYCFTTVTPINSTAFRISGNTDVWQYVDHIGYRDEWTDVTNLVEPLGDILSNGFSYYKVEDVNFDPGQSYFTRWTFTPVDSKKNGKWHILGYEKEYGIYNSIQDDRYLYLDPWWSASWSYKILANRTFSYAITGNFTFYSRVLWNANMSANCSDIRHIDATETTQLYQTLDSYNSTECRFWVIYPNPTAGVNNFYVYYGNPTAGPSNYRNIFGTNISLLYNSNFTNLGFNDFNTTATGAAISYANGSNTAGGPSMQVVVDGGVWDSTSRAFGPTIPEWQEFYFQADSTSNTYKVMSLWDTGSQYYILALNATNGVRVEDGAGNNAFCGVAPAGTWNHVLFQINSSKLTCWLNGVAYAPSSPSSSGTGKLTFGYLSGSRSLRGNITLTNLMYNPVTPISNGEIWEKYQNFNMSQLTYGNQQVGTSFEVTLSSPADNLETTSQSINFACAGNNTGENITKLTLLIDSADNYSVSGNTDYMTLSTTQTLSMGSHNWTCRAEALTTNATASIRNLNIVYNIWSRRNFFDEFESANINTTRWNNKSLSCGAGGAATVTDRTGTDGALQQSVTAGAVNSNANAGMELIQNVLDGRMYYLNITFNGTATGDAYQKTSLSAYNALINDSFAFSSCVNGPEGYNGFTEEEIYVMSNSTRLVTSKTQLNVIINGTSGNVTVYNTTGAALGSAIITNPFLRIVTKANSAGGGGSAEVNLFNFTYKALNNLDVDLVSPSNASSQSSTTLNFVVNATSNAIQVQNVTNITFYIWNSTDSLINQTTTIYSGANRGENLTLQVTIPYGSYKWNYLAGTTNPALQFWGDSNYSFTLTDTTAPTLVINRPLIIEQNNTFPVNITTSDFSGLSYCYFNITQGTTVITANTQIVNCTNTTTTVVGIGNYRINVFANDTSNNVNWTYRNFQVNDEITINDISINNTALETERIVSYINFSYNSSKYSIASANLWRNSVAYSATRVGTGDTAYFNVSTDAELAGSVNTFWEINLGGGSVLHFNTSTQTETVSPIYFALCNSSLNTPFLNFTRFEDEINGTIMNGKINSFTANIYLGSGNVKKAFSFANTTANPSYGFCFSQPTRSLYISTPDVGYSAQGYPQRTYSTINSPLTSTTLDIPLMVLTSVDGSYVTFQVIDAAQSSVVGALVSVSDSGGVIESKYTDDAGSVAFFLNPLVSYTVQSSKSGYATTTVTITPTQTQYTITMTSANAGSSSSLFRGLTISTTPSGDELNNDTLYEFNFTVDSLYFDITNFGFVLTNGTTEFGSASASTNGGTVSVLLNTGQNKTISMNYYYTINGTLLNGSRSWYISNDFGKQYSLTTFFSDLKLYANAGMLGLNPTSLGIIIFMIIFISAGVLCYKFGFTSPLAIMIFIFALVGFFDAWQDLLPTRRGIATAVVGAILIASIVWESSR